MMWKKVSVAVLGLALMAQEAMAQVFPGGRRDDHHDHQRQE
jgi:hypothetical protein